MTGFLTEKLEIIRENNVLQDFKNRENHEKYLFV